MLMAGKRIDVYSKRGQFTLVLLAALADMPDTIPSKAEVVQHIEKRRYLNLTPELSRRAYNSKSEPEWVTEVAMARRDAVDKEFIEHLKVRDAWEISKTGLKVVARFEERFKEDNLEVGRLEFLSDLFVERMSRGH
jgi:hypothetical protein